MPIIQGISSNQQADVAEAQRNQKRPVEDKDTQQGKNPAAKVSASEGVKVTISGRQNAGIITAEVAEQNGETAQSSEVQKAIQAYKNANVIAAASQGGVQSSSAKAAESMR